MMKKETVAKFRTRIQRSRNSFNVMGDMMLQIDIDAMTMEVASELQAALLQGRAPVSYAYLDEKLAKASAAA